MLPASRSFVVGSVRCIVSWLRRLVASVGWLDCQHCTRLSTHFQTQLAPPPHPHSSTRTSPTLHSSTTSPHMHRHSPSQTTAARRAQEAVSLPSSHRLQPGAAGSVHEVVSGSGVPVLRMVRARSVRCRTKCATPAATRLSNPATTRPAVQSAVVQVQQQKQKDGVHGSRRQHKEQHQPTRSWQGPQGTTLPHSSRHRSTAHMQPSSFTSTAVAVHATRHR